MAVGSGLPLEASSAGPVLEGGDAKQSGVGTSRHFRGDRHVHFEEGIVLAPQGLRTTQRRRVRKSAHRGDFQTFIGFNTSGRPQMLQLAKDIAISDENSEDSADLRTLTASDNLIAILGQEHQSRGAQLQVFEETLRRQGLVAVFTPATDGPSGGDSCGTLVATRRGRTPMVALPWAGFDCSPPEAPGRLTGAYLQSGSLVTGGVLAFSFYVDFSVPLWHPRNFAIFVRMFELCKAFGGPWLAQGDLNNSPEVIRQSGILQHCGGELVAPTGATTGSGMVFDAFIVCDGLLSRVQEVASLDGWMAQFHRPVRLRLRGAGGIELVPRAVQPCSFGRLPPALPCRQLVADPKTLLAGRLADEAVSAVHLEQLMDVTTEIVEAELCNRYDRVSLAGYPLKKYCGRNCFSITMSQVFPPVVGSHGGMEVVERGIIILYNMLSSLLALYRAELKGGNVDRRYQIAICRGKLSKPRGALGTALRRLPIWSWALESLLGFFLGR